MSSKFQSFLSYRENPGFKSSNIKLGEVISSYSFLEISEENEMELNFKLSDNIKESNVIIISHYEEHEEDGRKERYLLLSFKRTILIIKETRTKILQILLSKKEKLEICFMFDTKEIFENINKEFNETKLKYKEIKEEDIFTEEINEMNTHFFNKKPKNSPFDDIFYIIKTSISGYLIKQSYYTYNRIDAFNVNNIKLKKI